MKQSSSFLLRVFIISVILLVFYITYSNYLDKKIVELYSANEQTVNHSNGIMEKDKGNILLKHSLAGGNLLMMGSSELGSAVPENPKNLFPNNLYNKDITFVGHACVQNALHAMNLGANYCNLDNNDIVIINSLQWFEFSEIESDGFFSNFSELQFYEFLHNPDISKENKLYLCDRYIHLENLKETKLYPLMDGYVEGNVAGENILKTLKATGYDLVSGDLTYVQTYILARLYVSDNFFEKMVYQVLKPYYWLRHKFMILKDKYDSYEWLKTLDSSQNHVVEKTINWEQVYANAEKEGSAACTNNDLYVDDDYYVTYLKDIYESLEGQYSAPGLSTSNEWNDYKFFLKVCNDLDIHPYIVIMSTNGLYYDHVGIDKEKRAVFYNKMENTAKDYGMNCLNLQDYEYQPYFYCDVMHLGWKGWPYVVQNVIEYYKE